MVDVKSARDRLVDSPLPLALLRIVVALVILVSPELHAARALAASPERLGFVPEGLGLVARIPLGPSAVQALYVMALSSIATAVLGYWSRTSMAVLTLSAGLLFSFTQRQGAVLHDMHLFWMTALLAASPCGDALSLDAWSSGPRPAPSVVYGVPLFFARLLLGLGLVYFFPGLHKLRVSGLAWMSAENVTNQMHAKWLEHDTLPALRVDAYPTLCTIGAALAVTFELTFLALALWSRRTRWGRAGRRSRLPFLYAGLLPHSVREPVGLLRGAHRHAEGERSRRWRGEDPARAGDRRRAPRARGGGARHARPGPTRGPFACYPTFASLQSATIPDVLVEATLGDGTTERLTGRERRARSQDEWGRAFRLSGAYGDTPPEGALRDHARSVLLSAGIAPADVVSTRIYRVRVATAPLAWREPPQGGTLLLELTGSP